MGALLYTTVGVHQQCPLSPVLLNIILENGPRLLRARLHSKYTKLTVHFKSSFQPSPTDFNKPLSSAPFLAGGQWPGSLGIRDENLGLVLVENGEFLKLCGNWNDRTIGFEEKHQNSHKNGHIFGKSTGMNAQNHDWMDLVQPLSMQMRAQALSVFISQGYNKICFCEELQPRSSRSMASSFNVGLHVIHLRPVSH